MNTTQQLIARALPRGSRIHLVREGEQHTLCGIDHRMNARYAFARFTCFGNLDPSAATCPKCTNTENKGA